MKIIDERETQKKTKGRKEQRGTEAAVKGESQMNLFCV